MPTLTMTALGSVEDGRHYVVGDTKTLEDSRFKEKTHSTTDAKHHDNKDDKKSECRRQLQRLRRNRPGKARRRGPRRRSHQSSSSTKCRIANPRNHILPARRRIRPANMSCGVATPCRPRTAGRILRCGKRTVVYSLVSGVYIGFFALVSGCFSNYSAPLFFPHVAKHGYHERFVSQIVQAGMGRALLLPLTCLSPLGISGTRNHFR